MSHAPCRLTQLSCVALALGGMLPWGLLIAALTLRAIDAPVPFPPSLIAACVVAMLPVWVAWFAVLAWRRRNETALPAVLMALPSAIVTALLMLLPAAATMH